MTPLDFFFEKISSVTLRKYDPKLAESLSEINHASARKNPNNFHTIYYDKKPAGIVGYKTNGVEAGSGLSQIELLKEFRGKGILDEAYNKNTMTKKSLEKIAITIKDLITLNKNVIQPKMVYPKGTAAENLVRGASGLAGANSKVYKPKNLVPKDTFDIPNKKNVKPEELNTAKNEIALDYAKNIPSFRYYASKAKPDFGLEDGKIYQTVKNPSDVISRAIGNLRGGASRRTSDLVMLHHELMETKIKKPTMLGFHGHKSPDVIVAENNLLASLKRDNPDMPNTIKSTIGHFQGAARLDNGRKIVAKYVPEGYGEAKIPKAMRKHIARKYHEDMKAQIGTE